MNEIKIPQQYTPPRQYNICSNVFVNTQIPIVVFNSPLFLVSTSGGQERFWLYRVNPSSSEIVINENKVRDNRYKTYKSSNETKVLFEGELILIYRVEGDSVVIDYIDFTSIGLHIRGDNSSIKIGGSVLSRNTTIGARYGIIIN
ncbi:hypothetical protein DAERI_040086 [Deinococcus aerius]|uniref:Uncharacterized protein n=1 Tax=Deinococcus aerius TaxID=200253 RepID=A0A2I9D3Z2_9DEIO|nr:hypothetical protein [Deinococcus aerius]GBF05326.1 hypothetical protein DAERI_040086 [Deinococcus aerius]